MVDEGSPYDWPDEDMIIYPQGETAVYRNPKEATVIRQRDPFAGDEQFVVILPQYLPALIAKLQQHHAENEERKRG